MIEAGLAARLDVYWFIGLFRFRFLSVPHTV